MSRYKCRVCLNVDKVLSIFESRFSQMISTRIMSLAKVQIHPEDGLPDTICRKCVKKLDTCVNFIQQCEDSDSKLRASQLNNVDTSSEELQIDENFCKLSPDDSPVSKCLNACSVNKDTKAETKNSIKNTKLKTKNQSNEKKEKQQCFTCGKIMSSRFRLKTHLRVHSGERPFSCQHCKKTFALAQNLKIHLRIHTGEKPLKCSECDASFAHSSGLAVHIRKHTGQTPYCCKLCSRSFRTFGHLQYHIRRHTGEKLYECDNCGRAFITRSQLKQHLLSHGGERPHVCCVCGLRLTRASHLRRHTQLVHNSNKTDTHKLKPTQASTNINIIQCEPSPTNDSSVQSIKS